MTTTSDVIIEPARLKNEPHISDSCLFFVNPGESKFVTQEAVNLRAKQHFLFHSNLFELEGNKTSFWAGPAMGAPMAVMTMEKLLALGATRIVVFGWCGAINDSLKIGDLFVPTWGLSEEGTSQHYPCSSLRPETSKLLRCELIDYMSDSGYKVSDGPIWTTDAPYRETKQKINKYCKEGIMAVDMELSALANLAEYRNVKMAAVMLVSDELYHEQWRPGFSQKQFQKKCHAIFRKLAKFVDK